MNIRVKDDTIPKTTINMKLKRQYVRKKLLGCQSAHTKVETIKKLAVRLSKFLM
jgi:hypothetical protein